MLDTHMNQNLGLLQSGQAIQTVWPSEDVRAVGITCHGGSNTVVASSRFALYIAELNQLPGKEHVQFTALPLSEHIQGESLLDVSLRCGSSGPCHAVVLHGLGQRVSTFPLDASSLDATSGGPGKTNGEELLQDGTVLDESA